MMAGGELPLTRFWIAISPPKVLVFAQDASWMAALGAAALAHSASKIASTSSPFTPGSLQLLPPPVGAGCTCVNEPEKLDSPKVERKVFQSAVVKTSVSSITTTVWF